MAYMQRTRVLMDSDLDDDATWRRRIDLAGSVTAIEIRINCDRFADRAAVTAPHTLADVISKIELLKDATTPLLSLTGEQIDAMNYWDLGKPNPRRYRQAENTGNDLILFLMGGRDLYDREYGWDFDRLNKVYLEYTYDLSEGDTEYFKANDHDITIYAYQWKGANIPKFKGYLRSRQLDAWTTTAENAEHTVEVPASNPVRRICVQSKTGARTIGSAFSTLEVRVDKGAYSPVIVKSPMDWVMAEVVEYGLDNEIGGLDYLYTDAGHILPAWWSYMESGHVSAYASVAVHPEMTALLTIPASVARTAGQTGECVFSLRGWGFQKCLRIGFDHERDGFDLLRVPSGKALDLVCTEANADRAVACFFQDVISY